MSTEKKLLPPIKKEKKLMSNNSVNQIKPETVQRNTLMKTLHKIKNSNTSRSISIKMANNSTSNTECDSSKKRCISRDERIISRQSKEKKEKKNLKSNFLNFNRISLLNSSGNEAKKSRLIIEESNEYKIYYYKIFKYGNDSATIKKCFDHRENWQLAPLSSKLEEINLIWAPLSSQVKFSEINTDSTLVTMSNHYEFHNQLSNKLKMFKNLMMYCEDNNLDLFTYVPLTILIEYEGSGFLRQFTSFGIIYNNISTFLGEPGKQKESKKKYRHYFYVESESDNKIGLRTSLYVPKNHFGGQNLWLLKAMNLNRGLAIKIVDSIESCENTIRSFYQGGIYKSVKDSEKKKGEEIVDTNKKVFFELPKIVTQKNKNGKDKMFKNDHQFCLYRQIDYYTLIKNSKHEVKKHYQSNKILLQKYIEQPLLYNGRKFDVRMWVLLTHDMKAYLFKEGHLKATSYKYSLDSKDSFVHLTNYSVQKYCGNFAKYESGNEISFDEFQSSLQKDYNLNIDVRKDVFNSLKKVVGLTMKAVKKSINVNNRKGCFEIFGYDFMFDKDLNPYLIEINTNPGLEISSPLISKLVPRMIDDALRLTVDIVFGTIYSSDRMIKDEYISPYHVEGYSDRENMFDFVVDLNEK